MDKSASMVDIQSPPSPKNNATASKKTYQTLWKIIFLTISILSAFLFSKIYIYQTQPIFDNTRKAQFHKLIFYGVPFSGLFMIFDVMVHYLFDGLCQKYYINHNAYKDPQARKKRCYTLVKWGYSLIYYLLSSAAAFLLLKKTSYFPTWLGGNGTPKNVYNDYPQNNEFSFQIEVFYILQFGKHLGRTFGHLFIRPQGNYYEYALHHALSIFLITFSYLMDQWLIGCFVLIIHDFSDFTLILARAYKDVRNRSQTILKSIYVIAFTNWIACRIIIYIYALIYSLYWSIQNVLIPKMQTILDPLYKQTMLIPICFMATMLVVLQGLQLFWTYYIVASYISVNVSQKIARHNYD